MPIKAPNNSQAAHAARKIRWWYGRRGTVACLFRPRSMRFNSRSREDSSAILFSCSLTLRSRARVAD